LTAASAIIEMGSPVSRKLGGINHGHDQLIDCEMIVIWLFHGGTSFRRDDAGCALNRDSERIPRRLRRG
jgi:hypothetical protein